MIGIALSIIAMTAATAVAPAPTNAEIVVVAQRLERTKGQLKRSGPGGEISCRVTNTSGDARVDAAVCDIAVACGRADWRDKRKFRSCVAAGREEFLDSYFVNDDD